MSKKYSQVTLVWQYATGIIVEVFYAVLLAILALIISTLALRWF